MLDKKAVCRRRKKVKSKKAKVKSVEIGHFIYDLRLTIYDWGWGFDKLLPVLSLVKLKFISF